MLTFEDYPSYCLGDALNAISKDGKCFVVPDDYNHNNDWSWRFEPTMAPAIRKLVEWFEHEILEAK